jgi:PAS domain S-box-containing protein
LLKAAPGMLERVTQHASALASANHELKNVMDTLPAGISLMAPDGAVDLVNQPMLEYFGKPFEELRAGVTGHAIHPEDHPRVIEKFLHSIATGDPYDNEQRQLRHDGVYRWFQVRGEPLRDDSGRVSRWCILHTDIDERKRAEGLLAAEKRLLEMVASGRPLEDILETTCGFVDTIVGRCVCSILLIDSNWTFRHGAGPTLPPGYDGAVNGAPVVCEAGPCGTAASLKEQVIVPDLVSDQRWVGLGWRTLVLEHGLRSVCSTPIVSSTGKVLGTFAIYQREPGIPSALLTDLIARFTNVASIAIERAISYHDLQERERESRLIVDSMPGLVALLSASGELEVVNRHVLEYFGRPLEELKQWGTTDVVHAEDLPHVIAVFTRSIQSGSTYDIVQRFRRSDGIYRWFRNSGCPVRDAHGEIVRWCVLLTDIDERKRAEDAVRASERDLKLIIDTIPALAWSARPDGSADFFNQHYLKFVGLSEEQAKDWGWTAAVHPDDLSGLATIWQHVLIAEQRGDAEGRLRRHDGEYRWFLFRVDPLRNETGTIVKWYGVNTDIEDRKRAEAELRRAYDSFTDAQRLSKTGSFITDLVGDDHNWSEEAYRAFEFEPGTKVSVQRIRDMIHPDDVLSFESVIARGMTGENVTFAFRIVTARGALKHIRGVAHVIEHVSGRPLFVGALQDVTESKVAEEALDRARSELAHVARVTTLSALTASIAHEVNQPLSGIITNAGTCLRMLAADPPDIDGARETARRTLRDGNRAADVITRLRALFTKQEFTLEPLDINEVTREVIALSLNDLQRHRIVLQSEFADNVPKVTGDRIQLQQVVLNLLRNASDAMAAVHDRPRQLVIRTARDADRARVTVRDVGVGLDLERMNKVFDAFYTTKTDGMGIGLAVSRSIIEKHQGRLWAEPNEGPGATFAFSIPVAPEMLAEPD